MARILSSASDKLKVPARDVHILVNPRWDLQSWAAWHNASNATPRYLHTPEAARTSRSARRVKTTVSDWCIVNELFENLASAPSATVRVPPELYPPTVSSSSPSTYRGGG